MGILIGLIGVVITLYSIKLQFFTESKEELEHLEIQFNANQALSTELQDELEKIISKNNIGESEFYSGVTYRACLEYLRVSHQKYLSDEVINKAKSLKLTKSNILSMTQSLERQFETLSQIRNYLEIASLQHNN